MDITLIGAGNVATWIAQRLQGSSEVHVVQVFSRDISHAKLLADLFGADATDDVKNINQSSDIYLLALIDCAYDDFLPALEFRMKAAFLTSGTLSCRCLSKYAYSYGVIYPLQTFSKKLDMRGVKVPLCIEFCQDDRINDMVWRIAHVLSDDCYDVSEAQRRKMHLAAVFSSNFSNAMYSIAYNILSDCGLSFDILKPLIRNTVEKLDEMTPLHAQTGPAARNDQNVMREQLSSLDDEKLKELYLLVSEIIQRNCNQKA